MVMPGVGTEPGGPSRACDEAGSHCSRSLNESLSTEEVRRRKARVSERKLRRRLPLIQQVSLLPSQSRDAGENWGCHYRLSFPSRHCLEFVFLTFFSLLVLLFNQIFLKRLCFTGITKYDNKN